MKQVLVRASAVENRYFVDAVSLDLVKREMYTWKFCAEYFENVSTQISDGLLGEEGPSKTAC